MVVAEMSANHNQDFKTAVEVVLAAHWAGADAIKVQMFTPDVLADKNGPPLQSGLWAGKSLYDLYEGCTLPYEWVPKLKTVAEGLGLFFFTSVYDPDTVDIAEEMGIPAYKISSFELGYLPLIEKAASTGKPIVLSTGASDFQEIWAAIRAARNHTKEVWLLHCVSEYPAVPENMNLRTITDLSRYCQGRVGLSDHSKSIIVPAVAASMGAMMIEKHLKVDEKSPDAAFSMNPTEFKAMVSAIRTAEASVGKVKYGGVKKYRRVERNGKWLREENYVA